MAKKNRKQFQEDESAQAELPVVPSAPEAEAVPPVPAIAQAQPPVLPHPAPAVAKKRIRVRKKATKHLSVAVLCANPMTRRFI